MMDFSRYIPDPMTGGLPNCKGGDMIKQTTTNYGGGWMYACVMNWDGTPLRFTGHGSETTPVAPAISAPEPTVVTPTTPIGRALTPGELEVYKQMQATLELARVSTGAPTRTVIGMPGLPAPPKADATTLLPAGVTAFQQAATPSPVVAPPVTPATPAMTLPLVGAVVAVLLLLR